MSVVRVGVSVVREGVLLVLRGCVNRIERERVCQSYREGGSVLGGCVSCTLTGGRGRCARRWYPESPSPCKWEKRRRVERTGWEKRRREKRRRRE